MKALVEIGMVGSGACYLISAVGWLYDSKPWMAATFALYAITAVTIYLAGKV